MVSSKTKILGILGYPIGHSLSPLMHNAVIKKMGLDLLYLPFEVKPADLSRAVDAVRILDIIGVNVTIPYKENIVKYLDKISVEAKKIGAVNTIVNKNGKLFGFNTDYYGFLKSISEKITSGNKNVLMLGCGGVAKAIALSLIDSKINRLTVADIDTVKAKNFSEGSFRQIKVVKIPQIPDEIESADIFINATPVGMKDGDCSPIDKKYLRKDLFVYDVIYNRETQLIKDAKKIGADFADGLDMLVYQGAKSFELWTGKIPPVDFMKKVLRRALK
ncbi:MAG: shikimate dehydrogenase [Elusimicrobia bacterium CG06_land_8_20_14_3_00_38_11]|nr:MAG: shikimate dehydrogenase [Elusimicrobia bacterium CG06_land_8_20_14_3_00_38_11]